MFGERLALALKRKGLSQRQLAERMDPKITAQAVSKYERGKMMPSSKVLVGMAKVLEVSLDFLLSVQIATLEAIEFRKDSKAPVRDRAAAQVILIDRLERYLQIEEVLGIEASSDPFRHHSCDSDAVGEEIDAKADELRDAWRIGMNPVPSLCALLEGKGIKVIEADFPDSINGLTCRAMRGGRPVAETVAVSRRTNVERKRFNLAHELSHRVFRSSGNSNGKVEMAMNRFAGAFLVPRRHLLEEAGSKRRRFTYREIIRLKHTYGVSAATLLARLGQVGVLSPTAVEQSFKTFARTWRQQEPEPIGCDQGFAAFEKPQRFQRLVWRAIGEQLISPVRAAALLEVSLERVERQIRGPAPQ